MSLKYICVLACLIPFCEMVSEMAAETVTETTTETTTKTTTETTTETTETVMSKEMADKRRNETEMDQLQILHSTPEAAFFLEGCTGLYYNATNSSDENYKKERTFVVENEEYSIKLGLFSLYKMSILVYFDNLTDNTDFYNYVNIRIDRNTKASISGNGSYALSNRTEIHIDAPNDIFPGMPFYIEIKTANDKVGVLQASELRLVNQTGVNDTFLEYNYANTTLKPKFFRIEHDGPIYAHYRCCELVCKRQTFHRISGCQKYSTRSINTVNKFNLESYYKDAKNNETSFTFNGNFFIYRPEKTPLAAKIKLLDSKRPGDFYDVVLTDTYATIYQYVSKINETYNQTQTFQREQHNPVTINITVTTSGRVSLTRTYEKNPFMVYNSKREDREAVDIQSMLMSKVYGDANRYDFYYNCSDEMTYFDDTPRSQHIDIIDKFVKRFNDTRYDLLLIFNDSFDMNQKYGHYYNNDFLQFDETDFKQAKITPPATSNYVTVTKMFTGACSFLFVWMLKYITSLECVKNMTKDVDEEKLKDYTKSISKTFNEGLNVGLKTLIPEDNIVDI